MYFDAHRSKIQGVIAQWLIEKPCNREILGPNTKAEYKMEVIASKALPSYKIRKIN